MPVNGSERFLSVVVLVQFQNSEKKIWVQFGSGAGQKCRFVLGLAPISVRHLAVVCYTHSNSSLNSFNSLMDCTSGEHPVPALFYSAVI